MFPYTPVATFYCGLAGIVAYKAPTQPEIADIKSMEKIVANLRPDTLKENETEIDRLQVLAKALKRPGVFMTIFGNEDQIRQLETLTQKLNQIITAKAGWHLENRSRFSAPQNRAVDQELEQLRDIHWSLAMELKNNIDQVAGLTDGLPEPVPPQAIAALRNLNAVLNSIDRLEVRGRDSAGISLLFTIDKTTLNTDQHPGEK